MRKEKPTVEPEVAQVKKKRRWVPVLIVGITLVVLAVAAVVILQMLKTKREEEELLIVQAEETSGYVLDTYLVYLNQCDMHSLEDLVVNPVVSHEVEFINGSTDMQEYLKWVCSKVSFSGLDYSTSLPGDGTTVSVPVTISSVDWESMSASIEDSKVQEIMSAMGVSSSDLDISYKVSDLFISYIFSLSEVPVITTEVSLDLVQIADVDEEHQYPVYAISSDALIDEVLFGSQSFHNFQDSFAKTVTGWTGFKTEKRIEPEEQDNPEYLAWLEQLNAEIAKYPKWSSASNCLYEPYYLRDDTGNIVKDENGEKIVNFYVLFEASSSGKKIKDKSSEYGYKFVPEPERTIPADVEKESKVEDLWVNGSVFKYNFTGYAYVVENELNIRAGDGSAENPASEGTEVLSRVVTPEGIFDVQVSLKQSYIGADAIQYAIDHSEKNRGLDSTSVVKIVICEFDVVNLSDSVITFTPDMVLVDASGSKLSRTGTLYGLTESYTLQPGESVVVQDWASSTDLQRYQVTWGKSFDTSIPLQYFNVIK